MMSLHYPKRLIEVDLPIKRISAHARREKSIRHGHISTLHIWWARRPLAACRAVICAALWPDPADPLCPQAFQDAAARILTEFAHKVVPPPRLRNTCSPESLSRWEVLTKPGQTLDTRDNAHLNTLRFALLDFIADFANWDNSTVPEYLDTARALTQAAHEALGGEPGTRPLVVDPFAGGGSIPLEALRVGADAFASDLNPVAVLINTVMLEYAPKYGSALVEGVRMWGERVGREALKRLQRFYPADTDRSQPITYLWARTIQCEGPSCGAEIPLLRSLWLAKRGRRSVALQIKPRKSPPRIEFEIINTPKLGEVGKGTIKGGSVTCPVCGFTTPVESVRVQMRKRKGGAADARLVAVLVSAPNGRSYRLANELDLEAIAAALSELDQRSKLQAYQHGLPPVPDGEINHLRGFFNLVLYGITTWGYLFSPRQLLALTTLCEIIRELPTAQVAPNNPGLALAIRTVLALVVDRVAVRCTSNCIWDATTECIMQVFNQGQAVFD